MSQHKLAWRAPVAHAYGSFANLTREDITVCKFKIIASADGGTIGNISIADDPAQCAS